MIILPAIDIQDGTCVRLVKGDFATSHKVAEDYRKTAAGFVAAGASWIHMVDLDGARAGEPKNAELFLDVAKNTPLKVELGGGIRSLDTVEAYLKGGISRVILGSIALKNPQIVKDAIVELVNDTDPVVLHGYTNSNSGYPEVREAIAKSLNERFDTKFSGKNIVMTVGAAGGLNVILKSLINPGDEVIAFAPYFGEYRSYTNNYDGVLVEISPNTVDFQPKLDEFEQKITPKTKAVIVNNPNNPTGVVYSEETIKKLAAIMEAKQKEFGTDIVLISDEPYRELAYDGVEVPYLTKYYENTVVGYSYSKSLSLPGLRIGYLFIPD